MKDVLKEKYKGLKFNMLTSIRYVETKNNKPVWTFMCDCGKQVNRRFEAVKAGITTNCGCIKKVRKKYVITNKRKPKEKSINEINEIIKNGEIMLINNLFKQYKKSSIKRGHSFEIKLDYFKKLIFDNCFYCKSEPTQILKQQFYNEFRKDILYNGIDRILNKEGYTIENTVSCCGWCNRAKGTYDKDSFIEYLKRVKTN